MGLLLAFADFEKPGSTSGTHAGDGGAGCHIACIVVRTNGRGMLLSLGLSWLPRLLVLLVGSIQYCGMGLPSPASGGFWLCLL